MNPRERKHIIHPDQGLAFPVMDYPAPKDLRRLIEFYFSEKKIGTGLLVDLGAGMMPIANGLQYKESGGPTHILIDTNPRMLLHPGDVFVQADLDQLVQDPGSWKKFQEVLAAYSPHGDSEIDTIVASNVLNYVDYQQVIRKFDSVLNEGGHLFIANGENLGLKGAGNWDKRPQTNEELLKFCVEDMRYDVSHMGENYSDGLHMIVVEKKT